MYEPKEAATQIQAHPKNIFTMDGLSLAVLHSAVRGMHYYRVFPPHNVFLHLKVDQTSKYRYSVGVYRQENKGLEHKLHVDCKSRALIHGDSVIRTRGAMVRIYKHRCLYMNENN